MLPSFLPSFSRFFILDRCAQQPQRPHAHVSRGASAVLTLVGALLVGAAAAPAASAAAPGASSPNVILIVADDLGYADVGFNGCKDIPTPHLDRLASRGVRFTNGYVTHAFCSPSRAALLSGRYQQRFGHENNPNFYPHDPKTGLPLSEKLLPSVIKSAGYVSGHIGKWHLGAHDVFHPLRRGFDESFGFLGGGHRYFPEEWTTDQPKVTQDEYHTKLQRNGRYIEEKEYLTDALSREAAAFVTRNKDKPFFLYLAYNAPHTPLQATEKYLARFPKLTDKRKIYAAMISAMDDGIGRVMAEVEKNGLTGRTLVFFLSDNGGPTQVNASSNEPLRGGKGQLYEGGVRVPFIASWPGRLPEGRDYAEMVSSLDIFATTTALAGVDATALKLDGVNLIPFLTGQRAGSPHEVLYWRMGGGTAYAIRRGSVKFVEPAGSKAPEIYDLSKDLSETSDIAANRQSDIAALQTLKKAWNSELVAPVFEPLKQGSAKGKAGKKKKQP